MCLLLGTADYFFLSQLQQGVWARWPQLWQYWRQDWLQPEPNVEYLMLGSSSIRYFPESMSCIAPLNRGIGGASIADVRSYLLLAPSRNHIQHIWLYAGENDLVYGDSVAQVQQQYAALIKALRQQYPDSQLHLFALKPAPARTQYHAAFQQLNHWLAQQAARQPWLFFYQVNWDTAAHMPWFQQDGIHLTHTGYQHFMEPFNARYCE